MRCDNCGASNPKHTVYLERIGEVEFYCDACLNPEPSEAKSATSVKPDECPTSKIQGR